ncbi:LasU family protein [Agrilactobacillus fermenti]|uniref:LasU family protein n=1 Tax=Agrilactobacillus fermenti TaxID=2586909 RepID=UPI0038B2E166
MIGLLFYAWLAPGLATATQINLVVFSVVFLGLYTFFTVAVSSLVYGYHNEKPLAKNKKIFLGYMSTILVVVLLGSIYMMNHN